MGNWRCEISGSSTSKLEQSGSMFLGFYPEEHLEQKHSRSTSSIRLSSTRTKHPHYDVSKIIEIISNDLFGSLNRLYIQHNQLNVETQWTSTLSDVVFVA